MERKQINDDEKVNSDVFDWLAFTPPSDVNFKSNLERANIATINAVLEHVTPEGNKTRVTVLKARLRKLEQDQPSPSEAPTAPEASAAQVVAVQTHRIMPSPFEPQTRRRARFKQDEIESLGDSILTLGMFQPIVVRPDYPNFQIVFGERRFLACLTKGIKTIDCFIRDLSDAAVLELQYEENHRRQENNPLDDAFLFKFLKESEGYSEEQIADRLNTTRRNVVNKLKLNDLISDAAADLEAGRLPLKHAVYLAKFPTATQIEIRREKFAYKYNDSEEKAVSFDEFKAEVDENILRRLKNAPFNIGDPRLHIKGLICVECPQQTGTQNYLFPDHAGGDARCVNPGCFRLKTDTHLKLKREEIAESLHRPAVSEPQTVAEAVKAVPLVTEKSYAPERNPFGNEKVLTNVQPLPDKECEFSELGLAVGGEHKGKQVYICRNEDCEIHHPKPKVPATKELSDDDDRQILWANFNRQVLTVVREQILTAALDSFTDNSTFWLFDDLIRKLITEFWFTAPAETKEAVCRILDGWKGVPHAHAPYYDLKRFVESLDKRQQSQILFLLVSAGQFAHRFETDSSEEWLENVAADYTKLNYHRLDAEARFELAPEEFKDKANLYLQYIRNGHHGKEVPVFWIEEPDDSPYSK